MSRNFGIYDNQGQYTSPYLDRQNPSVDFQQTQRFTHRQPYFERTINHHMRPMSSSHMIRPYQTRNTFAPMMTQSYHRMEPLMNNRQPISHLESYHNPYAYDNDSYYHNQYPVCNNPYLSSDRTLF